MGLRVGWGRVSIVTTKYYIEEIRVLCRLAYAIVRKRKPPKKKRNSILHKLIKVGSGHNWVNFHVAFP